LRELDSSAQSSRALYDNFLQRYMQSTQELSLLTSEARVISRASPPVDQTSPKSLLVMALSSVGGLAFGFGLGLLRELLDRVFRTSKQVEEKLRLGCVAIVPEVGPVQIPKISQEITDGGDERRQIRRDGSVMWNVIYSPFSRYAESIRSLKLAADLNAGIRTNKVVGLTSSLPAEGKSSLAGALSLLCSQVGSRAILVDCDLRNPSLSESLSPHAESGLLEVIAGSKSLEEALWTDPATKLDFLPMVFPTRLAHSSEILAAEGTKALFERLRSLYDYVIVDLPPLAPVVDVRSTVNFVDSYFFVVRWGTTKIDVAEHALGDAKVVYDNILGAVLNRASINALSRFDGSRKDYYRNKSYARYGYSE
jgi:succinoglycan biosynthesis transport protein ExoP